jgi:hypothetical protein
MLGVYAYFTCVLTLVDLRIPGACAGVRTGVSISGAADSWGGATSIRAGLSW